MVGRVGWIPDKIFQIRYPSENPKNNKILIHIHPNMAHGRKDGRSGSDDFGRCGFGGYLPTPNYNTCIC